MVPFSIIFVGEFCVTIYTPNGGSQLQGEQYHSLDATCNLAKGYFSLELNKAYSPETSLKTLKRSYSLTPSPTSLKPLVSSCEHVYVPRENMSTSKVSPSLTITDRWSLAERTAEDVEHLLVKAEVILPGQEYNGYKVRQGELLLLCDEGLVVKVSYSKTLTPTVEKIELTDRRLKYAWGDQLMRICLRSSADAPLKGEYKIVLTEYK